MFKPLLHITIIAAVILFACPAFAESVSFQISVTIPPHAMPASLNSVAQEQTVNVLPKISDQQVIQQEAATRNNRDIVLQSVVVL